MSKLLIRRDLACSKTNRKSLKLSPMAKMVENLPSMPSALEVQAEGDVSVYKGLKSSPYVSVV